MLVAQNRATTQVRFYICRMRRQDVDDLLKAFTFSSRIFHRSIIGTSADNVKRQRIPELTPVNAP